MFEAVVMLCLGAADLCRPVLLPGYEAATEADCAARLEAAPPDPRTFPPGLSAAEAPHCRPAGAALDLTEVAPGVLVHLGAVAEPDAANGADIANIAVVIGKTSVAVIDSGGARAVGEALWRAIRARTGLPVSHVILTHMHPDHVFGASVLREGGAEVVGHAGLARALADRQENYLESLAILIGAEQAIGTEAPVVDIEVADAARVDLGGRVLELTAWPTAHTPNDLTVYDPEIGFLFAGDLVFDTHVPALDGSVRGWQAVLADLAEAPARQVIPGHGGPVLPWPAGGADTARYLDVLAADTRAAIDSGARLSEAVAHIAESERGHWRLFDAFNARNATAAFAELEWE
jgi:quinoprotein relay system zinc metallohydrolase 2